MSRRLPDDPAGSDVPEEGIAPPVRRRGGAHRAPRSNAFRAAVTAGVLLVVGLAAAFLILRPWADDAAGGTDPALADLAPDVVEWVDRELPDDTVVAAPEAVRAAPGSGDRFAATPGEGSLQVLEGEPPAGALVLARFEGTGGTTLSVIDPAPGRPTDEELASRRRLAAAVLDNPVAGVTGGAADVLRAGDVDARLLGLLAGLVSRMDVHVADLPPAPGEPEDPRPPARRLLVDEAGGDALTPGTAATDALVTYLEAQRAPYAPDSVETTEDGILVTFRYVSAPDAAVSAASS